MAFPTPQIITNCQGFSCEAINKNNFTFLDWRWKSFRLENLHDNLLYVIWMVSIKSVIIYSSSVDRWPTPLINTLLLCMSPLLYKYIPKHFLRLFFYVYVYFLRLFVNFWFSHLYGCANTLGFSKSCSNVCRSSVSEFDVTQILKWEIFDFSYYICIFL